MTNQFGKRLFNIFFKTYTEKVWGMSCKEISADWAAQRIKGLSLWSADLERAAAEDDSRRADKSKVIKTLIDTFRYPRQGPGMMWEACADEGQGDGRRRSRWAARSSAATTTPTTELWTVTLRGPRRQRAARRSPEHVISSAPMRQLVHGITPRAVRASRCRPPIR